jgi:hypothetical protein
MGNPSGAAAHVLQTIKPKRGTWMIVQPFAHGKVEENLNRVGRVFYSASTFVCVPASLNEKGPGLGCSGRPGEIERKS